MKQRAKSPNKPQCAAGPVRSVFACQPPEKSQVQKISAREVAVEKPPHDLRIFKLHCGKLTRILEKRNSLQMNQVFPFPYTGHQTGLAFQGF
jgi:hypothetical protein